MWHKPCRTFHPWCLCIKTRCLSKDYTPFSRQKRALLTHEKARKPCPIWGFPRKWWLSKAIVLRQNGNCYLKNKTKKNNKNKKKKKKKQQQKNSGQTMPFSQEINHYLNEVMEKLNMVCRFPGFVLFTGNSTVCLFGLTTKKSPKIHTLTHRPFVKGPLVISKGL